MVCFRDVTNCACRHSENNIVSRFVPLYLTPKLTLERGTRFPHSLDSLSFRGMRLPVCRNRGSGGGFRDGFGARSDRGFLHRH